jgi:thiol-disulfide isomerase/thioredoxin
MDLMRAAQIEDLPFRLETLEGFLTRPMSDELRPVVFRVIVNTCREMDDLEAATFYGEEALEESPGDPGILLELAKAYADNETSDTDRGIRYAERAMAALDATAKAMGEGGEQRLSTFVGSLLSDWGWLELRRGNAEVAEGMLAEASDRSKSPEVYFRLGTARERAGKKSGAKDDFAMALALSSGKHTASYDAIKNLVSAEGGAVEEIDEIVEAKRAEIATKKKTLMKQQSKLDPAPAPAFDVATLDGGRATLEDFAGSVVVLDFWATWCGPCRRELPLVQKIHETFKGERLEVLAVSVDTDTSLVRPYVERNSLTLPVAFGRQAGQAYGASSIPMLVLIDGRGQLRHVHRGYHPDLEEVLREEIKALLEEL